MDESEVKELCVELMGLAHPVYLTTVDERGHPQTRGMFNLRNKKMWPRLVPLFEENNSKLMILFSTNTSSPKIQNIRSNKAVSVYYCEPNNQRGVHLGGQIEIVNDSDLMKSIWHDGWERYYPSGYDDPDYTVLRLYPNEIRGWNQSHTFYLEL